MKTRLEKIRLKITGAPRYSVSPELDRKVQNALGWQKVSVEPELGSEETLLSFNWITPWLMNSFKQFAFAVAAIVLALGGSWFYNQNSYSYHLGKAKVALADLQSVLGGKPIARNPFVAQAFAEDSVPAATVNEAQVVNLAQVVVLETEKAIEIVENKTDPVSVGQALAEVVALQDSTVPVLAAAVDAMVTAEATQTVAAALSTTTTDQVVVVQAQNFVALAASNGETHVAIDMQTASDAQPAVVGVAVAEGGEEDDAERLEEAKATYLEAKAQIEKLKASGTDPEVLASLQAKLDKVVAAFEDGKIGRAQGLSTAIAAQGRHWAKKEVRDEKRKNEEAKGKESDEEDDSLESESEIDEVEKDKDEEEKDGEGRKESNREEGKDNKSEKGRVIKWSELRRVEADVQPKDSDEVKKVEKGEDEDRDESEKESSQSDRPRIPEVRRGEGSEEGDRKRND